MSNTKIIQALVTVYSITNGYVTSDGPQTAVFCPDEDAAGDQVKTFLRSRKVASGVGRLTKEEFEQLEADLNAERLTPPDAA